jgi:hypothetical protein
MAKKRKLSPGANPIANPDPNDAEEMGQYNQWNQGYNSIKEEKYETWTDSLQEVSRTLARRYINKASLNPKGYAREKSIGLAQKKLGEPSNRGGINFKDAKIKATGKVGSEFSHEHKPKFTDSINRLKYRKERMQEDFRSTDKKVKPFPKKVKLIKKKKLGINLFKRK